MALITAGKLPELDAAGGGGGGSDGGGGVGRRSMGRLLGGEEPGLLADGAALRRVVGAVYDSGVGVDDVLEGTNGGAGGVDVSGRMVDFGIFDLLAGEKVLELIP